MYVLDTSASACLEGKVPPLGMEQKSLLLGTRLSAHRAIADCVYLAALGHVRHAHHEFDSSKGVLMPPPFEGPQMLLHGAASPISIWSLREMGLGREGLGPCLLRMSNCHGHELLLQIDTCRIRTCAGRPHRLSRPTP